MTSLPIFTDAQIVARRPSRNSVTSNRPYAWLCEPEHSAAGKVEDVATVFLTNRECPFRCLMCDLWKNTLSHSVEVGEIPSQIEFALKQLPDAKHIKLYNSGNFFDARAIPPDDLPVIARQVEKFETVIVENHPRLCGEACLRFRDQLNGQLEIAVGLETAHPETLQTLNKRMTRDDFAKAVAFLTSEGIRVRTFILLRPPFQSEAEGLEWAIKSTQFAFECGVSACAIIPTRAGNGIMQDIEAAGNFSPPTLWSLEESLDAGLRMNRGRVFVDLWDIENICYCNRCQDQRVGRLNEMNLAQTILPRVECDCVSS